MDRPRLLRHNNEPQALDRSIAEDWPSVDVMREYPDTNSYVIRDWLAAMGLEQNEHYIIFDTVTTRKVIGTEGTTYFAMVGFADPSIAAMFKLAWG